MKKAENKLLPRFLDFIIEKKLLLPGEKVLLTVSGGLDSVTMVQLFSLSDFDFGIAHCNFSLRGKESDGDETFVKKLADKYKKQFHVKRFDTLKYAEESKLSIQEAARMLRYNWFEEIRFKHNYAKTATAHHLNDSIETFFINLMRGTGPAGLRGIPLENDVVIRPMLFAKRDEIEQYATIHKLKFREDSSNASDDYLRNRIRHHIIPLFKQDSEAFENHMQKIMDEFSYMYGIVDNRLTLWKLKNMSMKDGTIFFPLEALRQTKDPAMFLSLLLHSLNITGIDCRQVLASETPGKVFHAKNYTLLRDRVNLILRAQYSPVAKTYSVTEFPAEIRTRNVLISMRTGKKNDMETVTDKKNFHQVDCEKLSLPLTIRPWKSGDYFFPLGMKGKKKISDFYTDQKIDKFEKDKIYLLLSGKDIVCILGHRIDDRFKITASTKTVLTIEQIKK